MSTERKVTTSASTGPSAVASASRYSAWGPGPAIARQSSRHSCEMSLKITDAPRSSAPSPIRPSPQPTSSTTSPGEIAPPARTRSRTGASRSSSSRRRSRSGPRRWLGIHEHRGNEQNGDADQALADQAPPDAGEEARVATRERRAHDELVERAPRERDADEAHLDHQHAPVARAPEVA